MIMSAWNSVILLQGVYVHLMWMSTAVETGSLLLGSHVIAYIQASVLDLSMPEGVCFYVYPGYRECACVHL